MIAKCFWHTLGAILNDLKCLLLIVSMKFKKIQGLISGTISLAKRILMVMLHEGLVLERKHLTVVGFMDHHSYGK